MTKWVCGYFQCSSGIPVGQVRRAGMHAGCWAGRGVVPLLKGSTGAHVLMNPESVMCVTALVTFHLCQTKKGFLSVCILCKPYLWVLLKEEPHLEEAATLLKSLNTLLPFQTEAGIRNLCIWLAIFPCSSSLFTQWMVTERVDDPNYDHQAKNDCFSTTHSVHL